MQYKLRSYNFKDDQTITSSFNGLSLEFSVDIDF